MLPRCFFQIYPYLHSALPCLHGQSLSLNISNEMQLIGELLNLMCIDLRIDDGLIVQRRCRDLFPTQLPQGLLDIPAGSIEVLHMNKEVNLLCLALCRCLGTDCLGGQ